MDIIHGYHLWISSMDIIYGYHPVVATHHSPRVLSRSMHMHEHALSVYALHNAYAHMIFHPNVNIAKKLKVKPKAESLKIVFDQVDLY